MVRAGLGYRMLVRMGWVPGTGLGRNGCGIVIPVTAADSPLFEGVGLGCEEVPDQKVMASNVEQDIISLVRDPERRQLEFTSELSSTDRKLVHELARKHGASRRSISPSR